jgi:hypothetical protein
MHNERLIPPEKVEKLAAELLTTDERKAEIGKLSTVNQVIVCTSAMASILESIAIAAEKGAFTQ